MQLIPVGSDRLREAWAYFEPWFYELADATDGKETFQTIFKSILEDRSELWVVMDDAGSELFAVVWTCTVVYPSGLRAFCVGSIAGNEVVKWLDLIEELEAFAKEHGCDRFEVFGRKGWQRRMPDYKVKRVLLSKDL